MAEIGIAYGPVPSRRFGQSLGINNIPPKICTYSCVYCQLGRTIKMQVERQEFYEPEALIKEVEGQVEAAGNKGEHIDYLTFVPDGEPTLDVNLGTEIEGVKGPGIPVAVITNASLIWMEEVRRGLAGADRVSLKLDAVSKNVWRHMDRGAGTLELDGILRGIRQFSREFDGELDTETMLVKGINDGAVETEKIADFLQEIGPDRAYISVPTRPPAEPWVEKPSEEGLNAAYHALKSRGINVEYLIGYEGNAFAFTGKVEEDLLSITSVHPMRRDGVQALLDKAGADWGEVQALIDQGLLVELEHNGNFYYLRKLPSAGSRQV